VLALRPARFNSWRGMHLLPTTLLNPPTGLALLFFSLFVAAIG
jgi:hypothetical protein